MVNVLHRTTLVGFVMHTHIVGTSSDYIMNEAYIEVSQVEWLFRIRTYRTATTTSLDERCLRNAIGPGVKRERLPLDGV